MTYKLVISADESTQGIQYIQHMERHARTMATEFPIADLHYCTHEHEDEDRCYTCIEIADNEREC